MTEAREVDGRSRGIDERGDHLRDGRSSVMSPSMADTRSA